MTETGVLSTRLRNCEVSLYLPAEFVPKGRRVVRAIGFEAGEERRTYAHVVKAIGLDAGEGHRLTWAPPAGETTMALSREQWLDRHFFTYWYPLMEWGLDREACQRIIAAAGLPVPLKSSCFFCPAMKKAEIVWLQEHHPELLDRALRIEENAQAKLTSVKGLGRSFRWADYLRRRADLPLFGDCAGS
jgi:hypothetical protein